MPQAATAHGTLHYEACDQAAPWQVPRLPILFHHGIGASAAIWADWRPALVDAHHLVSFDMRGYGRSNIPAADFPWSLDLLVEDVFAVADAAGLTRFHLVGESIGGTVALAAALARPDRVATLTVSNGAHFGASIQRVEMWRRQLDDGGSKAWSDAFMRDRFHDDALSADRRAWFASEQEKWSRDSILNALAVLVGTDLTPQLGKIGCPTLLLHPDGSPFIPVAIMADLLSRLPDARLNVYAHARHGLPFSHATECSQALRAFLDSQPAN